MSAELDMSQYLDLFVQEADEQLAILEQEMLVLEKEPTAERLSAIFRAAHTLKGSSRAMGFANFASLTHEMENVLDALRDGSLKVSTALANVLLRGIDALNGLKESVVAGNGDVGDVAGLVGELKAFLTSDAPVEKIERAELPPHTLDALSKAATQLPVFLARFTLRQDCAMKFARAYMAIGIVAQGGELLASLPTPAELEDETFDSEFDLYFHHSDEIEDLRKKFARISEVESVVVSPFLVQMVTEQLETALAPGDPTSVEAPAATAEVGVSARKKIEPTQTVRVEVSRLDELMNLVGELVIDRTRISELGNTLAIQYPVDESVEALNETVTHISRITSDLQDQLMKARMLPIETVFNRFPRMVRDLAQKTGKEVRLDLIGAETELDRSVIEVIGDPLLHILRNSVDHGLESPEERVRAGKSAVGVVTLSACHRDNHIVIEIVDDGKGIDLDRVRRKAIENGLVTKEAADRMTPKEVTNFIFESGLSTAAEISEVSGRGVGMDIVRSNIMKLGGLIDVETTMGVGTRFSLRLPLTLAIIRGLLVKVAETVYVLPLGSVIETLKIARTQVKTVRGRQVVVIRDTTTPLFYLRNVFNGESVKDVSSKADSIYVVVVGLAEQRVGLVVDSLVGEHEVVIKSLSRHCGDVNGISGATILGNGKVALIADVSGLLSGVRK